MKKIVIVLLVLTSCITVKAQSTWKLDKNHARLGFSILHMKVSHVEGNFKDFDINVVSSRDDFTDAVIELTADISSVNTENSMRDKDLRSEKYFDADKYQKLTFKSTSFKKIKDSKYKLKGNITIHGVTKPIALDVDYNGTIDDSYAKTKRAGFTIIGKLNRLDFGVGSGTAEMVLGNEVRIISDVELLKQ